MTVLTGSNSFYGERTSPTNKTIPGNYVLGPASSGFLSGFRCRAGFLPRLTNPPHCQRYVRRSFRNTSRTGSGGPRRRQGCSGNTKLRAKLTQKTRAGGLENLVSIFLHRKPSHWFPSNWKQPVKARRDEAQYSGTQVSRLDFSAYSTRRWGTPFGYAASLVVCCYRYQWLGLPEADLPRILYRQLCAAKPFSCWRHLPRYYHACEA